MKRQVQEQGIKKWSGNDLLDLQGEPLKVLDGFFSQWGDCIVCGCKPKGNALTAGIVSIGGTVMPLRETQIQSWPAYLIAAEEHLQCEYADGQERDIAIDRHAVIVTGKPTDGIPYIEIQQDGEQQPGFFELLDARWLDELRVRSITEYDGNMNNCLQQGIYPWCTTGRPPMEKGKFTLVVRRSTTPDTNGYTTIEQTAYGRDESQGKVFKRVLFQQQDQEVQYMDWIDCTAGVKTYESIQNMDEALQTGIYLWCLLGRPDGSEGAYTCFAQRSGSADGNGYFSVLQTAFGRQQEAGRVFMRTIFYRTDRTGDDFGKWVEVTKYTLPTATASALGGVKSKTTGMTAGRDYDVEVNEDGTMKVNVPWNDTKYTVPANLYAGQNTGSAGQHAATQDGETYIGMATSTGVKLGSGILLKGGGATKVTSDDKGTVTVSTPVTDLSTYAKKTDLNNYAKQDDLENYVRVNILAAEMTQIMTIDSTSIEWHPTVSDLQKNNYMLILKVAALTVFLPAISGITAGVCELTVINPTAVTALVTFIGGGTYINYIDDFNGMVTIPPYCSLRVQIVMNHDVIYIVKQYTQMEEPNL